jgi:hypothetical protein
MRSIQDLDADQRFARPNIQGDLIVESKRSARVAAFQEPDI